MMERYNSRRGIIITLSSTTFLASGCLGGTSPEEEVADVINGGDYDYARESMYIGLDDYEEGNPLGAYNSAEIAYESFSDPLEEAQNGARSSEGREEELYELLEEHLRLARGACSSLMQAADERMKDNQELAKEHYSEATNRVDQAAQYANELTNEIE